MTSDLDRGALLLRNREGALYRLSWGEEDPQDSSTDRRRALPHGVWDLVGYRLLRESDGVLWHVSASGPSIQKVRVRRGRGTSVTIDPTVRAEIRLAGRRIAVAVRGHRGAGLSIYRDGRRIPLEYAAFDAAGLEIDRGPIEYG